MSSWLDAWRERRAGPGVFPRRQLHIVYRRRYQFEIPLAGHDARRGARVLSYLASRPHLRRWQVHRPRRAPLNDLAQVHTEAYLDALQAPGALTPVLGLELPDRGQDDFLNHQRAMVGGTILAARLVLARGGIAVNLGGGLHHATADRGQGFCAFNDLAVAVAESRRRGFAGKVLVLDLDLHDGEGTRAIFADDPSVHTFSIHNRDLGSPATIESTSVALGTGVDDASYLAALNERMPQLLDRFGPALVFYLAGSDVAIDDALGDWKISDAGILARDRAVVEALRLRGIPGVILMAGGYGSGAWRHSARSFDWLLSGDADPPSPPPTLDLTLAHLRKLSRLLPSTRLSADPAVDDWSPTAEELFTARPLGPTRLLNFYSRHGVEMALQRYGVLDHMRQRGFDHLSVEFDLGETTGQTVRVMDRGEHPALLMELRVRRDSSTVPGANLLAVDWLLLQNPRAKFLPERPALPGQQHPGLGLLREITSILVLACERVGLDGILLTPSHYHIAAQNEALFHFLRPRDEAHFRALSRAVAGLRLADAIRVLDQGRVVRRDTGEPVRWQPSPLILPVSEELRRQLCSPEHERAVLELRDEFDFVLVDP